MTSPETSSSQVNVNNYVTLGRRSFGGSSLVQLAKELKRSGATTEQAQNTRAVGEGVPATVPPSGSPSKSPFWKRTAFPLGASQPYTGQTTVTDNIYDLAEEPKGDVYRKFIRHSLGYCNSFQFVIRPTVDINESCKQLLNKLKPFLLNQTEESQWPGTQLLSGTAEIYSYNLTQASVKILAEVTDSLYAWLQPDLPEDLCFLRPEGRPWLVTIAHEGDGYLELSTEERDILAKKLPELVLKKNETYH